MQCSKCGKPIGPECPEPYDRIYQVRVGDPDSDYPEADVFLPDRDVGYFCAECLSEIL